MRKGLGVKVAIRRLSPGLSREGRSKEVLVRLLQIGQREYVGGSIGHAGCGGLACFFIMEFSAFYKWLFCNIIKVKVLYVQCRY